MQMIYFWLSTFVSQIERLMCLLPSLLLLCCPPQVTVSSWPHLALCTSQKCRRKMLCPLTAALQSTNTVERLARATEPGSLLWVGNEIPLQLTFLGFLYKASLRNEMIHLGNKKKSNLILWHFGNYTFLPRWDEGNTTACLCSKYQVGVTSFLLASSLFNPFLSVVWRNNVL